MKTWDRSHSSAGHRREPKHSMIALADILGMEPYHTPTVKHSKIRLERKANAAQELK
jgi:hypothetical protein